MVNENKFAEIKFVPSTPKTYEVRYLENKRSNLSPAARNKVINKSGGNYLSLWADTDIDETIGYGPMANDNDFYCLHGDCLNKVGSQEEFCSMHSNVCSTCGERIPSGYNYCPSHINACTVCKKRISSDEVDCSECLEEARERIRQMAREWEEEEDQRASEEQSCRIS